MSVMVNSSTVPEHIPSPDEVVVALMGMTGTGKSTFITHFVDGVDGIVGHSLQGHTKALDTYRFRYPGSVNVCLVDTPGFDDTNVTDSDVLKTIGTWLKDTYDNNKLLNGIIYLHRITDPRMQGTARKNLFIFQKLCGKDALQNVMLATTMWDDVKEEDGKRREAELIETQEFWGSMHTMGAGVVRHYNTRESAERILEKFFKNKGIATSLQKELKKGTSMLDTEAGKELDHLWIMKEKSLIKEIETAGKDLEDARKTNKFVEDLEARLRETEAQLAKINEERRKLKEDLAKFKVMTRWVQTKTKIAGQGATRVLRQRLTLKPSPGDAESIILQESRHRENKTHLRALRTKASKPAKQKTKAVYPPNQDARTGHLASQDANNLQAAIQDTSSLQAVTRDANSLAAVIQDTDSLQPTIQATESLPSANLNTNSLVPVSQGTDSLQPTIQATESLPSANLNTNSLVPVSQGTDSSQPTIQATESLPSANLNTNSLQPENVNQAIDSLRPASPDRNLLHPATPALMPRRSDASDSPYRSEGESSNISHRCPPCGKRRLARKRDIIKAFFGRGPRIMVEESGSEDDDLAV